MFNFQVVIFALIMAVVGLGVDYHQQSLKADLKLGDLSIGDYVQTISGRFSDVQQAKADKIEERGRAKRWRAGVRPYLPEAPEGWTRREWNAGDNSRISEPAREMADFEEELLASNTLLKNMAAASEKRAAEEFNSQTWVYERGDEIVSVRARVSEAPKGNTISANAMNMIAGNLNAMNIMEGWGVIQGVAYGTYSSFASNEEKDYLTLSAVIGFGDEVKLNVRTNTSDAATREILDLIDYDEMNALLPRPLAHVGKGAKEIPLAQQADFATRVIELREDLIQQRTAAAENWLRSASSPEDAMTLALRQTGFGVSGTMGAADAALSDAMEDIEAKGVAAPDELASLDQSTSDQPLQTVRAAVYDDIGMQRDSTQHALASVPLPDQMILELQSMSASDRSMAEIGLGLSVRKFEKKNGLLKGSCEFSMVNYRVECGNEPKEANSGTLGSILSSFMKRDDKEEAAPAAKPKRLQLSGGTSCMENSQGGFCKN